MSRGPRIFLATFAFVAAACFAAAANDSQVIYPAGSPGAPAASARPPESGTGIVTVIGVLALAGAGAWLLIRGRKLPGFAARDARKLAIAETRSLGSRQYLVVASYEGQKMLLGVCPGRIELLTRLDVSSSTPKNP